MSGIILPKDQIQAEGIGAPPGGVISGRVLDPIQVGHVGGTGHWTLIKAEGPSILYPLYGPDNPGTPWTVIAAGAAAPNITNMGARILYCYKQPQADNVDPDTVIAWQPAVHGGICYFDREGDWYVWTDTTTVGIPCALIRVHTDIQAQRFLDGLRPNTKLSTTVTLAAAGTGTAQAALVLGWDIKRRSYAITNNSGKAARARFGLSGTGPVVPLADTLTLVVGIDEAPFAPCMVEAVGGAAVADGLTLTVDLM